MDTKIKLEHLRRSRKTVSEINVLLNIDWNCFTIERFVAPSRINFRKTIENHGIGFVMELLLKLVFLRLYVPNVS